MSEIATWKARAGLQEDEPTRAFIGYEHWMAAELSDTRKALAERDAQITFMGTALQQEALARSNVSSMRDELQAKLAALEKQEPVGGARDETFTFVRVKKELPFFPVAPGRQVKFSECKFSESPPQPFTSWDEWANAPVCREVLISAAGAAPMLSKVQTEALRIVLQHYAGDKRIDPLRVLLAAPQPKEAS